VSNTSTNIAGSVGMWRVRPRCHSCSVICSMPLELLKACIHDVASRNSLACRPIPASSWGKILLNLVAGGRPPMVHSANRGRDTARDQQLIWLSLRSLVCPGTTTSSRGRRGMVREPDRRSAGARPRHDSCPTGQVRDEPATLARQPSLVRGVQSPLGAFTPRTRRATHSRSSARHCD